MLKHAPRGALLIAAIWVGLLLIGLARLSSCSCREVPLAEDPPSPLQRPRTDGAVPEEAIARTEGRWLIIMLGMLGVMMAVILVTGIAYALHPSSKRSIF